jgi:hypothetical protein
MREYVESRVPSPESRVHEAIWGIVHDETPGPDAFTWPLLNVWLGTSVEDQAAADERVPELLATPAAVRFLSCEPLLGPVSLRWLPGGDYNTRKERGDVISEYDVAKRIDWVIVGGESGVGARAMDVAWARSLVAQCRSAGVPVFVKQMGARMLVSAAELERGRGLGWKRVRPIDPPGAQTFEVRFRHPKGGEPSEWFEELRVREFPAVGGVA